MEQQKSYIIFQCYGNENVFVECTFALLSLSRLYKPRELSNTEIWIYTDNQNWFTPFKNCWLPLHFRVVDKAQIKQWRGAIDFVHRVKIEMLLDFTKDHSGNVLYCDTDVIFTHRIDEIFESTAQGNLYMHLMEGKVSDNCNPLLTKLNNYLHKAQLPPINGKQLYDFDMWNAGVLGFNTSSRHLLTEVLAFTDNEYPKFPKHIIEQFAFSIKFQSGHEVKTALPYILHYWNFKEVRGVFASFLSHFKDSGWDALTRYSSMLQVYELILEKTRFLYNRGIKDKILNKQWQPEKRDWKALQLAIDS
jgi:hypothetical protein